MGQEIIFIKIKIDIINNQIKKVIITNHTLKISINKVIIHKKINLNKEIKIIKIPIMMMSMTIMIVNSNINNSNNPKRRKENFKKINTAVEIITHKIYNEAV